MQQPVVWVLAILAQFKCLLPHLHSHAIDEAVIANCDCKWMHYKVLLQKKKFLSSVEL